MTNATGSVFHRCCDCRNVAFTLVSEYTVQFRKRFHHLYGIEHKVLHFRLRTNNASTRLKTQVLCLFLCSTTSLLFVCCPRGFFLACSATSQDSVSSTIAMHSRLISENLWPLLAVFHAHSTRTTPFPLGSGTKCNSRCCLCWCLLRTHPCPP